MVAHEEFMRAAMDVAARNRRAPFGTVLVDAMENKVIATGVNRSHFNPILHGEIDAINSFADRFSNRWSDVRLYTTAEPCCMCQSAIIWTGIPSVIFGTSIEKLTELGWNQFRMKATDVVSAAPFAHCEILGGVLARECDQLFERART